MSDDATTPRWRAGASILVGLLALVALIGGLGAWSVQARIAGAVVAPGMIELESNRQVVQHPDGGVVGAIVARDGDVVAAGDVLLRLEDSALGTERTVTRSQLSEVRARIARLMAERDGAETVAFPDALMAAAEDDPEIAQQIAGQRELFTARRASVERTVEQLREQTAQIENQIAGIEAQLSGLGTQRTLVEEELADKESLLERGLTQRSQVSTLRRELARLVGEIGALEAEIARARGQIAGLNIEILKLDTTRREEAISRLRDLRAREAQLAETLRGLEARQERLTVRAPVSGVVHGSEVFAVKSVVQAGAPLMYIIPQDQPLVVAVRLQPIRIDEVRLGQEAGLRFTAFDQRTTPEIAAYVSELSADVLVDEATGATFYRAELIPREGEMARLGAQPLVPGMPVEAYIHTGERTPLSYLLKPLTDYFNRAMRE